MFAELIRQHFFAGVNKLLLTVLVLTNQQGLSQSPVTLETHAMLTTKRNASRTSDDLGTPPECNPFNVIVFLVAGISNERLKNL